MPPAAQTWDDAYGPPAGWATPPADRMAPADHTPVCSTLAEAEASAIRHALGLTGYNRTAAAKILHIHRSTLLRKIRLLGLD